MIFGDDGFRDRVGTGFLRIDFLNNFFESLNFFLKKEKIKKMKYKFGGGDASNKIVKIIKKIKLNEKFMNKRLIFN